MIAHRYVRNSGYARFRIPVSENIPFSLLPWPPPVFSLECLTTTARGGIEDKYSIDRR